MAEECESAEIFPLVSIVTPAYNAVRHIRETIASVQKQSLTGWELLVVDDCSKDETASIVHEVAEQDHRIRLLRQEKNGGPAAARQRAIEAARARYIAFLDSDDLWLPEKLNYQLGFMRQNDAALTFTAYRRISEDGSSTGRLVVVPRRLSYRGLLKNTAIATSTVIIDRVKTGPFSMTRTYYDDYALWLNILRRGHIAYGLRQDLMRYRVVSRSVSRNKGRSAYWVWRLYRDVEKLSLLRAIWCFMNYAVRALIKYHRF
jgi:teichuronic acid biosynthesis glycosyltransferase TuaG